MPSLNEYVLTLKKHNPKTEDRLLKIYLLKAGWPIADIEKAFGEYYARQTAAANASSPSPAPTAAAITPEIKPVPVAAAPVPMPVSTPVQAPATNPEPKPAQHPKTEIEIAAPEIENAAPEPVHISTAIPMPSSPALSATPATALADIQIPSSEPMGGFLSPFPNAETAELLKESDHALPTAAQAEPADARNASARINVPSENAAIDNGILLKTPTVASIEVLTALAEGDRTKIPGDPSYVMPDIERDLAMPHIPQNPNGEKISTAPSEHVFVPASPNAPAQNVIFNSANTAGVTGTLEQNNLYHNEHEHSEQTDAIRQQMAAAHASNVGVVGGVGMVNPANANGGFMSADATVPSYASIINAASAQNPAAANQAKTGYATQGLPGALDSIPNPAPTEAQIKGVQKQKRKSVARKVFGWLLLILLLCALAYGYLRYVHGIYFFVKEPVGRDEVLSYITDSVSKLETAEYTTRLTIKMGPKEPGTEALDLDSIVLDSSAAMSSTSAASSTAAQAGTSTRIAATDFLAAFPVDGAADIAIRGFYQRNKENDDKKLQYAGSYTGEGITAKIDVETVNKGGALFVKANEFPEMLFDIRPIKGKWVSVNEDDQPLLRGSLSGIFPLMSVFEESDGGKTGLTKGLASPQPDSADRQIARLLSIASDEKVLKVVGDPVKIMESGSAWYQPKRVVYQYEIKPDLTQFLSFIDRADIILQNEFGTSSILALTPEQKAEIHGPAFAKFFEYFAEQGYFKMSVDKDRAFVGLAFGLNLISETKRAQIDGRISLDGINHEVLIDKPNADLEFKDAYAQITGQSQDMIVLKNTVRVVEAIRAALAEYQTAHSGALPDNLMALLADPAGIKAFASEPGLDDKNLLNNYQYKKVAPAKNAKPGTAAGYQLAYQIKLPSLPEQFYELHENLIGFDAASAVSTANDRSLQYLKFVNGKNTATLTSLSLEADATKRLDSDKDLVTNGLEQYIGTNITKKDTDGDGIGDYAELQKGGNPLGAGSWVVEKKPK